MCTTWLVVAFASDQEAWWTASYIKGKLYLRRCDKLTHRCQWTSPLGIHILWSSLHIGFGLGNITCFGQWDIRKLAVVIDVCLLRTLPLGMGPPFCKEAHPILEKEVLGDKNPREERAHLVEKLGALSDSQHQVLRHEHEAFLGLPTQPSCQENAATRVGPATATWSKRTNSGNPYNHKNNKLLF